MNANEIERAEDKIEAAAVKVASRALATSPYDVSPLAWNDYAPSATLAARMILGHQPDDDRYVRARALSLIEEAIS